MPITNEKIAESLADYHAKIELGARAKTFRVTWEIDLEGADEAHAALQALSYLRDPQSTATTFEVQSSREPYPRTVDLASAEEPDATAAPVMRVVSPKSLEAFALSVAQLHKWGEPNEEQEAFMPSDGSDDSHGCLMDLIDEARKLFSNPTPPNLHELVEALEYIASDDIDSAVVLLLRQNGLKPELQQCVDSVVEELKARSATSINDAELSLAELINEISPGFDSVSGDNHYGTGDEKKAL